MITECWLAIHADPDADHERVVVMEMEDGQKYPLLATDLESLALVRYIAMTYGNPKDYILRHFVVAP